MEENLKRLQKNLFILKIKNKKNCFLSKINKKRLTLKQKIKPSFKIKKLISELKYKLSSKNLII